MAALDPSAAVSAAVWNDCGGWWGAGNQVRRITPPAASAVLLWGLVRKA